METVTFLRELWRRRIFVGLAALVAIFVGLVLTYRVSLPPESRTYEVGLASARILVDTPRSQVVDVAPRGSEVLGARANLLATLMTEGEVKAAIGRRAGLRPKQLVAVAESVDEPPTVLSSAKRKAGAHLLVTRLVINPTGDVLPIIQIETQAPDAERAARLADAAVAGLGAYLNSKAAVEKVSNARRLEVTGLGAPQARLEARGPRPLIALVAAIFVFLAGCGAILGVSALARGWRAASVQDEFSEAGSYDAMLDAPLGHDRDPPAEDGPESLDWSNEDWGAELLTPSPQAVSAPADAADNGHSRFEGEAEAKSA